MMSKLSVPCSCIKKCVFFSDLCYITSILLVDCMLSRLCDKQKFYLCCTDVKILPQLY